MELASSLSGIKCVLSFLPLLPTDLDVQAIDQNRPASRTGPSRLLSLSTRNSPSLRRSTAATASPPPRAKPLTADQPRLTESILASSSSSKGGLARFGSRSGGRTRCASFPFGDDARADGRYRSMDLNGRTSGGASTRSAWNEQVPHASRVARNEAAVFEFQGAASLASTSTLSTLARQSRRLFSLAGAPES